MTEVTVKQLADVVGTPVERLLEQLEDRIHDKGHDALVVNVEVNLGRHGIAAKLKLVEPADAKDRLVAFFRMISPFVPGACLEDEALVNVNVGNGQRSECIDVTEGLLDHYTYSKQVVHPVFVVDARREFGGLLIVVELRIAVENRQVMPAVFDVAV